MSFIFPGKEVTPKSVNDVKLIHGGQFLDNRKTLSESRVVFDGNVITVHVVVQPNGHKNTGLFNLSSLILIVDSSKVNCSLSLIKSIVVYYVTSLQLSCR